MMPTLYNGISGVKTHSFGIDIVGNNVSNVNTIGYKSTRAEFNDVFYQALSGAHKSTLSNEGGVGAFGATSALQTNQGILKNSSRVLDVALEGKGFFGVMGVDGSVYYTRNGSFHIDSDYNLVDNSGNKILGMQNPGMANINIPSSMQDMFGNNPPQNGYVFSNEYDLELGSVASMGVIKIPNNSIYLAEPTTHVKIAGSLPVTPEYATINVDIDTKNIVKTEGLNDKGKVFTTISGKIESDENVLEPKKGDRVIVTLQRENEKPFSLEAYLDENLEYSLDVLGDVKIVQALIQTKQEQESSKNFITDIIDANGNKSKLTINISRILPTNGVLSYKASANIEDFNGNILAHSDGVMEFSPNGFLKSNTLNGINYAGHMINLNFGTPDEQVNTGYNSLIAMDNIEIASSFEKDGSVAGIFKGLDIDERGNVLVNYTNGKSQSIAKIALYNFINEQGLEKAGENIYSASANSGEAYFVLKDGKVYQTAIVKSRFLEGSNVDLGHELTQMIIYQKAYEANAKSISTADAMLKRAIDMKK